MATKMKNGWARGTGDDMGNPMFDRVLFIETTTAVYYMLDDEDNTENLIVARMETTDNDDMNEEVVELVDFTSVELSKAYKLLSKGGIKKMPSAKDIVWLYTGKTI
jgi:hypothetical protein